jgi:hypothetical protein
MGTKGFGKGTEGFTVIVTGLGAPGVSFEPGAAIGGAGMGAVILVEGALGKDLGTSGLYIGSVGLGLGLGAGFLGTLSTGLEMGFPGFGKGTAGFAMVVTGLGGRGIGLERGATFEGIGAAGF